MIFFPQQVEGINRGGRYSTERLKVDLYSIFSHISPTAVFVRKNAIKTPGALFVYHREAAPFVLKTYAMPRKRQPKKKKNHLGAFFFSQTKCQIAFKMLLSWGAQNKRDGYIPGPIKIVWKPPPLVHDKK